MDRLPPRPGERRSAAPAWRMGGAWVALMLAACLAHDPARAGPGDGDSPADPSEARHVAASPGHGSEGVRAAVPRGATLAAEAQKAKGEGAGKSAGPAIARDVRLAGDSQRTRLVIDLSRTAEFRVFTLANPYRVVVDLSEVVFAFEPRAEDTRRGLVTAYRFGVFAPGKARLVMETDGPAAIDKAFVLDALDDQPARLVVDLVRSDPDSFSHKSFGAASPPAPPPPAAVVEGDARPMVVLDPGHGGIDSGTSGRSAYNEKAIVLAVGLALRDTLEKSGRYRVVMTRDSDVFVPLADRVRIARANRADLFLSLHADALARGDGKARGASVYTLSERASDAEAAHLADKENKADLIAGVDLSDETDEVADILVDLAQRETRNFSATFAHLLVDAMKENTRFHASPLKSAGFRVLKAHDVPSVLVELGYMSSREDLKLLTSDAWRERTAKAIKGAIDDFFASRGAGTVRASESLSR